MAFITYSVARVINLYYSISRGADADLTQKISQIAPAANYNIRLDHINFPFNKAGIFFSIFPDSFPFAFGNAAALVEIHKCDLIQYVVAFVNTLKIQAVNCICKHSQPI